MGKEQAILDKPPTSCSPVLWEQRYEMLDAWRGLAAATVVLAHVSPIHLGGEAVMCFFVISGYCIWAAAESCRRHGLGFPGFMWRRFRRIYPPYLLAIIFWTATRGLKIAMGGENELARSPLVWIQNLTLTQWLSLLFTPIGASIKNSTNFVNAFWSLNYEEQFYLVVGLMILLAGRLSLGWILAILSAISFVWIILFRDLCYGFFIEYWFHFSIGILVFFRLCRVSSPRWRRMIDLSLAIGAGTFMYSTWLATKPLPIPPAATRELGAAMTFALFLIVLRPINGWFKTWRPGRMLMALGLISYSLYLIHQFNLVLVHSLVERIFPERQYLAAAAISKLAIHIGMATVFWWLCERPFVNRSLDASTRRTPAASGSA